MTESKKATFIFFRQHISVNCIFLALQINEKHREFNIPTYMAFIDFKKSLWLGGQRQIMYYYVK